MPFLLLAGWARRAGAVLAYAVEDEIVGDPDANQVSWLGTAADTDVLAVADQQGLNAWHDALDAAGIRGYEVHCETLMLPWIAGEWSLAWNGREGFVRTSELEGTATDCGDPASPPLSLRLMLDEAKTRGAAPASIAVYATAPDAQPPKSRHGNARSAWRCALPDPGTGARRRPTPASAWRRSARAGACPPARWHACVRRPGSWAQPSAVHALALVVDWTRLASEQRSLRPHMVSRFRAAFPDAVAVADPALQMRRKLAEARHAAGQPDSGDFLPMIVNVAAALKQVPPGGLRVASYESGRMTLELAGVEDAGVRRIVARLLQAGLQVDKGATTAPAAARSGGGTVVITVRSS